MSSFMVFFGIAKLKGPEFWGAEIQLSSDEAIPAWRSCVYTDAEKRAKRLSGSWVWHDILLANYSY